MTIQHIISLGLHWTFYNLNFYTDYSVQVAAYVQEREFGPRMGEWSSITSRLTFSTCSYLLLHQGRGEHVRGSAQQWVRGLRPPRRPENFRKFSKNSLRKQLLMHYFSIFFKRFNKPRVNSSRVWTKNTNCREILRNFRKFLIKIQWENWIFNDFWKGCY